ncbi:hypothetical protein GCM10023194_56340 [Planotetraspora phitsanulokensis]|uniref:Cellulose synthase n=1 Tax=Planotetraspora phitsanulokensis TaxID=575192 RepID=A0A8J3XHT5_9ACTN|nr:cellulose synthase [Planotetraspora phitsanulokensis]GII42352.1 hypothetical protein Pph01_73550 [Planotetraspora phitsanulokensis]
MTFDQIAWLPLSAGVTAVGIALSYLAFRRRGLAAGLRATAWSLLPLAAYLTGALRTVWNIGSAVVGFVTGLVFSPMVWAGVAVTGVSVLLFFVSGGMRGRALSRARAGGADPEAATKAAPRKQAKPAGPQPVEGGAKPAPADDFSDIEDILKRRGIS